MSSELDSDANRRTTFAATRTGQERGLYVAQCVIGCPLDVFFCISKVIVMQSAVWRSGDV